MSKALDRITGHVDAYSNDCVRGWAFDADRPGERLRIDVRHNGEWVCSTSADLYRDDLRATGHGDGCYGFEIALPLDIFSVPTVVLHVHLAGGRELMGSPLTVRNHRPQLEAGVLASLSGAIRSAALAAQAPGELGGLASWLIEHFDVVFQRQAALAGSAHAQLALFHETVTANTTLSSLLQQAAAATVERYGRLSFEPSANPDVSIIIPAHNHFDYTYRCLASIVEHLPAASIEVIVVDDASTDETVYAGLVLAGGFRIIRNSHNVGFLHSVMAGARVAAGAMLFLLNNDCEVHEGWLDALCQTLVRHPGIAVAGAKLLSTDGRLQEAGGIIWKQATGANYGRGGDPDDPRYCFMRDADYVSGAALLIRRTVFDAVGGLSEAFAPAYYEDTDLCFKVRAAGHRVVVQPRSRITHHEGVSSGRDVEGGGAKRFQRVNHRTFLLRWQEVLKSHGLAGEADLVQQSDRAVKGHVLFIDDTVPTPDQDAGSNAAVEHMRGLLRLGFRVSFVGADNMASLAPYTGALEAIGVRCYYAPYSTSLEEILRNEGTRFDVFYVHRLANMARYAAMIRHRNPKALLIYSVADLHHIRHEREAALTGSTATLAKAESDRQQELAMAARADSVIVHSTAEAAVLTAAIPRVNVHTMTWSLQVDPVQAPFQDRRGVAFIGGYNHTPNVDAAVWLVQDIMPLVWLEEPGATCLLIGSHMPAQILSLAGHRVALHPDVPELGPVLAAARLTVAPLRFGAGLKGKVLTSLAAGLPCVSTPLGVEGMGLPAIFGSALAETASGLAATIVRLYRDEAASAELGQAGLAFIAEYCSEERLDQGLRAALKRPPDPIAETPPLTKVAPMINGSDPERALRRRRA